MVYNDSTDSTSKYNDSSVVMVMFGYVVVTTGGFMAQSMVTSGSILGCSTLAIVLVVGRYTCDDFSNVI